MSRRCVVITYDPENERLVSYSCEEDKIKPAIAGKFELPLNLEDFGRNIDDEFARKFGVASLSVLALYNPELKDFLNFTIDKSAGG